MLTQQQQQILQQQLAIALSQGDPRNAIRGIFVSEGQAMLASFPANINEHGVYASFVIAYCLRSRWSGNPPLLEQLLSKLLADGVSEGTDELNVALANVRNKHDPNDNIYDSHWVLNHRPFLNRKPFRPQLRAFIQNDHLSLLRVNGPGAGRSYTAKLLDYLGSRLDDLNVVPIALDPKEGSLYKAQHLADDLVLPMGLAAPDDSPANLCRFILRSAVQKPGLWIFVLDGFDQADIDPGLKALITLLVQRTSDTPAFRKKLRIVLVNHAEQFECPHIGETIPLPSVNEQDVVDCLTQLNAILLEEGRPQIDPAELPAIAQGLFAQAPAQSEKERLHFLNDQLRAVSQKFRGVV